MQWEEVALQPAAVLSVLPAETIPLPRLQDKVSTLHLGIHPPSLPSPAFQQHHYPPFLALPPSPWSTPPHQSMACSASQGGTDVTLL